MDMLDSYLKIIKDFRWHQKRLKSSIRHFKVWDTMKQNITVSISQLRPLRHREAMSYAKSHSSDAECQTEVRTSEFLDSWSLRVDAQ
jgi:transposase